MRRCSYISAALAVLAAATIARAADQAEPIKVATTPAVIVPHEVPEPRTAAPPATTPLPSRMPENDETWTLVLGGDVGLNGSRQPVREDGALRHGTLHRWDDLTRDLKPLITGDINFANLETVVTDRNDIYASPKAFNFRSHPAGVSHLAGLGFNVFSTANNHALDYGETGARETLRHLESMAGNGLKAWPGLGIGREHASRPADFYVKGARVRVSAIGIGGHGLDGGTASERAGMLAYRNGEDFSETVDRLGNAYGDLRILSVHYGAELQVRPDSADEKRLRDESVISGGIDIVVGHHAHVPAGVQRVGSKLVFYGLGNLLHPGMQDMARMNACRDYGLMARVHLARGATGQLVVHAVEVIPLTDMHARAAPLTGDKGRARVEVLNHLANGLDDVTAGAQGVRFVPQPGGTGLYCMPGADQAPGRIGALCRDWKAAAESASGAGYACGGSGHIARRRPSGEDAVASSASPRSTKARKGVTKKTTAWFFW